MSGDVIPTEFLCNNGHPMDPSFDFCPRCGVARAASDGEIVSGDHGANPQAPGRKRKFVIIAAVALLVASAAVVLAVRQGGSADVAATTSTVPDPATVCVNTLLSFVGPFMDSSLQDFTPITDRYGSESKALRIIIDVSLLGYQTRVQKGLDAAVAAIEQEAANRCSVPSDVALINK